jgi:hypothetical protein
VSMGKGGDGRGGVGQVMKIKRFEASTAGEVGEALRLCEGKAGKVVGGGAAEEEEESFGGKGCGIIVIDLRGNRGGP